MGLFSKNGHFSTGAQIPPNFGGEKNFSRKIKIPPGGSFFFFFSQILGKISYFFFKGFVFC